MLLAEVGNCIQAADLRVQLVSPAERPAVQDMFRQYVDSRVETYRRLPDVPAAEREIVRSKGLQGEIWREAIAASVLPHSHRDAGKLLLPALNHMTDISTTRTMAIRDQRTA